VAEPKKRVNGKAKGSNFERKVAKLFSEWWGEEFHRTPGSGGLKWKDDNSVSGDIVPPKDSKFPFNIECKKHEGWDFEQIIKGTGNVVKWWNQCTTDADVFSKVPLLVFSKNRSPIYFMLRYEDFKKLSTHGTLLTNYFLTTLETGDGELEHVGIGFFDNITEVDKDCVIKLFSEEV